MPYVALVALKIQRPDGTIEVRKPGEPVPEAEGWKNLDAYVRSRRVGFVAETETPAKAKGSKTAKPTGDATSEPAADAIAAGPSPLFGFAKARK